MQETNRSSIRWQKIGWQAKAPAPPRHTAVVGQTLPSVNLSIPAIVSRLLTVAALIALVTSALFAADAPRRAPGFSLPDVQQQQHDLADYRGKVVILEFMQTTCPHCNAFADVLEQVQQKYGDRVAIISVVNPPDDQPKVRPFIAAHRITYPVVFDCGQVAYSYLRTPSFDIPHVFLIDANGGIREDFGYTPATRDIFEGKGIFSHLDLLLKK